MKRRRAFQLTEIERKAWEMRASGKTWAEIGEKIGVSPTAAEKLVRNAEKKMRGVKQLVEIQTEDLLAEEQRRLEALKARLQGKHYDEIARLCGYASPQAAKDAVMEAIRNAPEPVKEEIRRIDIARLDELYQVAYAKALDSGDPRAVNACLNIIERRWKLYGIAVDAARSQDDLRRRLDNLTDEQLVNIIKQGIDAMTNPKGATVHDETGNGKPAKAN